MQTTLGPIMNLEGKTAVVTGSSRGIGRATALALAERGCAVVVNYRQSADEAKATAQEVSEKGADALCVEADVADEQACIDMIEATVAEFGGVDILVNNAGTTEFISFDDLDQVTDAAWDRITQTNVKGPFYCARAAHKYLRAAPGGGEIVNIASIAGFTGNGSSIPYCVSKAGLINLTKCLARSMAPEVRVNAVAPGFIANSWMQNGLGPNYEPAKKVAESRALLNRVCEPSDVADAVLGVLAGSDLVTGHTVVCDGGWMLGL